MRATDVLMEEHRVIEEVLTCLERMANDCAATGRLDADSARQALDFFRTFADGCHHGKEEHCLFPIMEAAGFSPEKGPTSVMRSEHEAGRWHIRSMAGAVDGAAAGAEDAVRQFVSHAHSYVRLLREHICKEDHCLFPMANQALSASEQQDLLDSFGRVEHHDMGAGTHEHYLRLAGELARRWQVRCAGARPGAQAGQACCHHGHP